MKRHQTVWLVALSLLVLAPVQAEATSHWLFDLCKIINCAALVAPKPKIDSIFIFSNATPGGFVLVVGKNFGSTQGKFFLKGLKKWNGQPYGTVELTVVPADWKTTFVGGRIPSGITAVWDQQATLQIKRFNNVLSNEYPVNFRATQDIKPLPKSDVQGSCSDEADSDWCSHGVAVSDFIPFCYGPHPDPSLIPWWAEATFYGEYWTCVGSSDGTDSFSASLKNGWSFDHAALDDVSGGGFPTVTMSGFQSGATSTNVNLKWNNAGVDYVHYRVMVSIVGPKGVPHK